ncbi:MAG TPA: methyl-accepting chemotaxis protein, partial [Phototrophicaceae bacterium]|nr:methyl-accepting chemotaxis protein [Phototrophicaceae bacterium]
TAPDSDPFIQSYIKNEIAGELSEYHDTFPENLEVLVTDKYGALMAATQRTAHFVLSDEEWWQGAWNDGEGSYYISQPVFDETTHSYSIIIAQPLYGHNSKEVIGILQATVDLTSVIDLVAATQLGRTGRAELLVRGDQRLRIEDAKTTSMDAATLAQIQGSANADYIELVLDDVPSFVSQAPIASTDANETLANLGWVLLLHQNRDESLEALTAIDQTAFLITVGALLVAGLLALGVAQIISGPIVHLSQTVRQITAGDLSRRVALHQRDEIGQLASSFNQMADSLQHMVETERASKSYLENTVTDYMNSVRNVSSGDLTTRLNLKDNNSGNSEETGDNLYQLGVNLNDMVESLNTITRQVRESVAGITSAAAEIQAATTQQIASTTEQDTAVTQTVATVEELRATVQQTAERAQAVSDSALQSVEVSRRGEEAVADTVGGMQFIRQRVENIAETILSLSERTQQIGEIINTVNAIADQSKLLALNASIEAARAGDEGRGFAVVAAEVRQLAEQSRQATARIGEILNEIQQATNTAVMVTEEGSKGAERGVDLVNRAGEAIRDLAATLEEATQAAVQI